MYREDYINSLRNELLDMVRNYLTPVAIKYGYSEVPLETNIKWRPLVLFLGNYSSGKSTLINEFLGSDVQATGQAPTDDSFTVITYDESADDDGQIRVTEERDGKFLLNDPEYPFENLKKHGQRFIAHFRLKKVNSPFLKTLAIIDTPGMLDSITERDRGYKYQEIIGDLAQIADLVLVLFDPHKAGTVREAHESLRETLPMKTFEDRMLFVLNRIDECASLVDLIRVYGTLCWNLSQMTGRKDIPMIRLTYAPKAAASAKSPGRDTSYLRYLENQRDEIKAAILQAPRHRLDHLATFVETHGERLSHFLEGLASYRRRLRLFRIKFFVAGFFISLLAGAGALGAAMATGVLPGMDLYMMIGGGGAVALLAFLFWLAVVQKFFKGRFHRRQMENLDDLTPLDNQTRRDSWQAVKALVANFLKKTGGRVSYGEVRRNYASVKMVYDKGSREIREALNELAAAGHDPVKTVGGAFDEQQPADDLQAVPAR